MIKVSISIGSTLRILKAVGDDPAQKAVGDLPVIGDISVDDILQSVKHFFPFFINPFYILKLCFLFFEVQKYDFFVRKKNEK